MGRPTQIMSPVVPCSDGIGFSRRSDIGLVRTEVRPGRSLSALAGIRPALIRIMAAFGHMFYAAKL